MNIGSTRLAGVLLTVSALLSCGDGGLVLPNETGAANLTLIQGNNQSGRAGAELPEPLVVKVVDRRGEPVADQRVAFVLATQVSGARVTPDTAETGEDGMAQARWVLGNSSEPQSVTARVVGASRLEVTFSASVAPVQATRIQRVSGDDQSARAGTTLADPLVVRVSDGSGNPVPGVTVEWSADQGSVSPASTVTGNDGQAATSWTLGASAGSQTASASGAGLEGSPLQFEASALSGEAARLERVSGNNQSAPAGTELPEPLVVQLLDEDGQGVPNQAVSWVVASGGGSVSSPNTTTDADGRASTRWTLGTSPGSNTLNAVVSGIGVVGFSATGTGGGGGGASPSRLDFRVQPSDTEEDERISPPVEVAVLDQAGNLVTQGEFEIKLELIGDGGRRGGGKEAKLKGDDKERTVAGIARFSDLRVEREGDYRLRASTGGLPSVDSREFEVEDD